MLWASNKMTFDAKKIAKAAWDGLFFISGKDDDASDAWKFRRRLIYGSYLVSVFMIVFGAIGFFILPELQELAIVLVKSATALLTIIVSAYVAGAIVDDKLNKKDMEP